MEVLRDHLLGVSESGKVSGGAVGRAPTGGQTGGRNPVRCAAGPGVRSVRRERRGAGVELEGLALAECQKNSGAGFLSWPGSNVLPEAGSLGVRAWVGQPFRLQWKGEQSYTLANRKEVINKPEPDFIRLRISGTWHGA